ncbi:hypothetical protein ACFQ7N_07755 [Streptomyces niveus]|uniref:hypothetical protein n=1 Tax=Streptomyces niveus TaxID=193462 RepID=UPI0036B8B45C
MFVALGRPVTASVPGVNDARTAMEAGAATVSSSTMGYPAETYTGPLPDLGLVKILVAAAGAGRGRTRLRDTERGPRGLDAGAHAVVVGSAIIDPVRLTVRFAGAAYATHPVARHADRPRPCLRGFRQGSRSGRIGVLDRSAFRTG